MANKREKERRERENLLNQYKESRDKLLPFYLVAAIICAVSIFGYFFNWVYIYAPSVGAERSVSGFSAAINALTLKKYTSANIKVYGDMNLFYYYAKKYCVPFATISLVALILTIISTALGFVIFFTKRQELSLISELFTIASTVMTIICFGIALSINESTIIADFCGNPLCSVRSLAIIPALVLVAASVVQGIAAVKYFLLRKNNPDFD